MVTGWWQQMVNATGWIMHFLKEISTEFVTSVGKRLVLGAMWVAFIITFWHMLMTSCFLHRHGLHYTATFECVLCAY